MQFRFETYQKYKNFLTDVKEHFQTPQQPKPVFQLLKERHQVGYTGEVSIIKEFFLEDTSEGKMVWAYGDFNDSEVYDLLREIQKRRKHPKGNTVEYWADTIVKYFLEHYPHRVGQPIYYTFSELSRELRAGYYSVIRAVEKLEDEGYLHTERYGNVGRRKVYTFYLKQKIFDIGDLWYDDGFGKGNPDKTIGEPITTPHAPEIFQKIGFFKGVAIGYDHGVLYFV